MSYPPPHDPMNPQLPSVNLSTPPLPPPKPTAPNSNAKSSGQFPPTLPPYPQQHSNQTPWHEAQYNIDGGAGTLNQQHIETQSRYEGGGEHMGQQYHSTNPVPQDGWVPEILLNKSNQDLQALLSSPALLSALLHNPSTTHPSLPASSSPIPPLLHQNTHLATAVLTLLSTVTTARHQTQTHLLAVRALEQQWKKKQAELERKLEPWGPRELHQRLGAAIVEGEALCKGVEESFLEGEGEVGEREVAEWVKRVREGRKTVALRRERKARWDEGRVGGWR